MECLKTLQPKNSITSVGYGPYDNGYLQLGLSTGTLLILDPSTLDKLSQLQLSTLLGGGPTQPSALTSIACDPTNHLFTLAAGGDLLCLTLDQHKRYHYLYLELPGQPGYAPQKIYCTTLQPMPE